MDEESDGILLVFLHQENLMDLTRELWILKNQKFLEKFSIVKGVVFVEEIVRLLSKVFCEYSNHLNTKHLNTRFI